MNKLSQKERIVSYLQEVFGTEPEYLWAKYPEDFIFRHPATGKWFALMMRVSKDKLGLAGEEPIDVLDVKCSPLMIGSLLSEQGFLPAYHMSKSSWISILLDESLPDDRILPLLELSYDSVAPKPRKPAK